MSTTTFKSSLAILSTAVILVAGGCSQQQKTGDEAAAPEQKSESTGWFQQKKQTKEEAAPEKKEESTGWFQQKKQNKDEANGEAKNEGSEQHKDSGQQKKEEPATPAPVPAPAAPVAPAAPAPAAPVAPATPAAPVAKPQLGTGVVAASETAKVGEGDEFGYIAQNMGDVELTNVVLVLDFGSAFEYKGTDFPGTVTRDGAKVTLALGKLAVGKSVTLKFTADCKVAGAQMVKTVTSCDQTASVLNDEKVTITP